MSDPILDVGYWKERLTKATEAGEPHRAIWDTTPQEFGLVAANHSALLKKLIEPTHSVLDVGCGMGRLFGLLGGVWQGDYLGVDISPDLVRRARQFQPGRAFLLADLTKDGVPLRLTPDREVKWDWAVMLGMERMFLTHLGPAAWDEVARKVRAVSERQLYLEFTGAWRAESNADEFHPYGYAGRVTLADPKRDARIRVTLEVERGKMDGNEVLQAVGGAMDGIAGFPGYFGGHWNPWHCASQEICYGREVWLPRESTDPTTSTKEPTVTALQRAQDLFCNVKRSKLPPLARDYHDEFIRRVGMCSEMSLTAFAAYAEIVEGCPANDPEYVADTKARAWFEARLAGVAP